MRPYLRTAITIVVLVAFVTAMVAGQKRQAASEEPPLAGKSVQPQGNPPRDADSNRDGSEMQLTYRAGSKKGEGRILFQRKGFEIEATRIIVGNGPMSFEAAAGPEGIHLLSSALTTVCPKVTLWPKAMGSDSSFLPSNDANGDFHVVANKNSNVAWARCNGFQFEFSKLTLSGEVNKLEVMPTSDGQLQVQTKNCQVRCENLSVSYQRGCQLNISAAGSGQLGTVSVR